MLTVGRNAQKLKKKTYKTSKLLLTSYLIFPTSMIDHEHIVQVSLPILILLWPAQVDCHGAGGGLVLEHVGAPGVVRQDAAVQQTAIPAM